MAHRGIAIDHPENAAVIAHLSRPAVIRDRAGAIRKLEQMLAERPDPTIARALEKLRNGIPDPPRLASQPAEGADRMALGTHPDIVDHLWAIGARLPTDCSWVAFRQPVLAHSVSGIIFGLGIGTLGYALRLPPALSAEAMASGATQTRTWTAPDGPRTYSLAKYGPDWWFGLWRTDEDERWSRAAYDYFGAM